MKELKRRTIVLAIFLALTLGGLAVLTVAVKNLNDRIEQLENVSE